MIKNVLITGGTGFIGSHTVEELINAKYNIVLFKRSYSNIWRIKNFIKSVNAVDIDSRDIVDLFQNIKIDAIIHMATLYKKFHQYDDIEGMFNSNITFPVKILELAVKNNVKYFINTGTFFEYKIEHLPIKEDEARKEAFNLYSSTKLAFEEVLKYYCQKNELSVLNLNIFSPYGERDNELKMIPSLIIKTIKNQEIKFSEGYQKLDFIYVKDVANAYIQALHCVKDFMGFHEFNIGTGKPHSIREIVALIEEMLGEVKVLWGQPSLTDIPICYADINKSRSLLHWEPKYELKEGLRRTIDYYKGLHS